MGEEKRIVVCHSYVASHPGSSISLPDMVDACAPGAASDALAIIDVNTLQEAWYSREGCIRLTLDREAPVSFLVFPGWPLRCEQQVFGLYFEMLFFVMACESSFGIWPRVVFCNV